MDPLSLASTFATLVSLLGQFKSGRDTASGNSYDEFMQWLATNNHSELKSLVEANHATTIGIKAILHQNQEWLKDSLERIDNALAAVTSSMEGFSDLGRSLRPDAVLSEQAISILEQIEETNASKVMLLHFLSEGIVLMPMGGTGGQIEISEPRFFEGDMQSLVDAKLLIPGRSPQGKLTWTFTRAASAFVKARSKHD